MPGSKAGHDEEVKPFQAQLTAALGAEALFKP
jgi:hypothetical protein